MKTSKYVCGIVFAVTVTFSGADAQPTVYIVRHAEKIDTWPGGVLDAYHPLSAEGVARAESLAVQFNRGDLEAIYSSRTTRSLHTALPLSHKLELPILEAEACIDTSLIDAFFAELNREYRSGQTVLLVSHSDIIPHLLIKAGLPPACREHLGIVLEEGEWLIEGYDGLWRIDRLGGGARECAGIERRTFWVVEEQ